LRPNHAETWSNQGVVLVEMGRAAEAVTCFDQALQRKPDHPEAWYNRGNALRTLGRFTDATTSYERAIVLKPGYAEAQSELIHLRQLACDWRSRAADDTALLDLVHRGHAVEPFVLLGTTASPTEQLRCARQWAARFQRPSVLSSNARQKAPGERIRLGYLSGDFRHHPLAFLMVDLLAQHDRSRFEVIGYDIGPDDGSAIRGRVVAACDRFVELRELSDLPAAQAIARDGMDIVVDLSGYTSAARPDVLAYRPAPLQVSYLGYIGSMGADFVDYVIADAVALPSDQQEFYDERIVHLPVSYQANGTSRAITDRQFSRVECGLPVHGCVFCCFNTSYKITPKIFAIWMRLLAGVPDSVLWLVGADPLTESNLQREAAARGIAAERLVFAPKIGHAEHLARYRLADLFLDTLPYSAGATASDALWAGLPVLTQLGAGFAGRMAASVLTAVGLPELIANSAAEYEAKALRLATHPAERQLLRTFLQERGRASSLFDAVRCARHLEAAFAAMWQRRSDGLPPAGFAIAEAAMMHGTTHSPGLRRTGPVQVGRGLTMAPR
jgi:predicted O-linked N-acetylglucosamine transferase (SPINDLY family)